MRGFEKIGIFIIFTFWFGGIFADEVKKSAKYLELVCPGVCSLDDNSLDLKIDEDARPIDMVDYIGGWNVFAAPKPMCSIRAPLGRRAQVKVTVDGIKSTFRGGRHHYLQVNKSGNESAAISCAGHNRSCSIALMDDDIVELAPRLSLGDCAKDQYIPVQTGARSTTCYGGGGQTDFTATYKLRVECNPMNGA